VPNVKNNVTQLYQQRTSSRWTSRLARMLHPPQPLIANPRELPIDSPLGRWNLYIGGAGSRVDGDVNVDLFPLPGVDVVANAEQLPFRAGMFQRAECDAVLEHVEHPERVMSEIERVLAPGGFAHVVTPFCHPFHEYPRDFRRFTTDGLKQLAGSLEIVGEGWRTGPTATLLVFILEYVKIWLPWRPARVVAHGVLGWLLFPFRYLDLVLLRSPRAGQIGNHCYVWLRKR
jgi:SAM-dependent methyltransferase